MIENVGSIEGEVGSISLPVREVSLFDSEPNPLYYANLLASERIVVNQGGTYSSKSYSIMQVLCTFAVSQLNVDIVVAGASIPKLKEDVMKIMAQLVLGNKNLRKFVKSFNIQDRRYVFSTGSSIEFKSYEDAEMAKGGKHHYLYVSEATRFDYATFDILNRNTAIRTFVDYNPTFRFWVHDIVLANKVQYPSTKMIRSWHEHNRYISQDKHDEIERISDKAMWRVYARGLTGKLEGLVYSWGAIESVESFGVGVKEVIWGIDWGYTNDPTAITKVSIMDDGSYVVEEKSYSAGISAERCCHILRSNGYEDGQGVYCDHDKEMIYRMRLGGVIALSAEKGSGSILTGILHLKQLKIFYTFESRNLAIELSKYSFVEVDGNNTNKTIDKYNHLLDSARMAIYSHRYRV